MNINLNQKRQQLLCDKPGPCAAVVFSGRAPMRSADGAYPFSVDRDFYYLTGIDHENMILVMTKDHYGKTSEMLFIEPYDEVQAKWVGGRMKPDEATAISGVQDIRYLDTFESALNLMIRANRGEGETNLWLDLWKHTSEQEPTLAHKLAHKVQQEYPAVRINDLFGDLARMRAIKSDEEIEKMKAEAEANAEADKKEREKIDKLNQADSVIFQTENQLKELGDKLPADKKAPIEAALQKLKDAHKSQDLAAIDTAMAEINTVFQTASAEMYAQGGAQGGAQAGPDMDAGQNAGQDNSKHGDNVQDADFEEVK